MDENAMEVLSRKLDLIIKLIALGLVEGKKQPEQIRLLSAAGFQPKEIAQTIGTTPNTVRVALSQLRKLGHKTARPKPVEER